MRNAAPVLLLIVSLGGVLAAVAWGLWQTYSDLSVEISPFGWFVMAAGTVLSLALAAGLMALTFHSARHGYDDRPPMDDAP